METPCTFDPAEFLDSAESILHYLKDAFAEGDPEQILLALGDVARAQNMAKLARDSGVSREGLYKGLSANGNPSFANVSKIIGVLGYRFDIAPITAAPVAHKRAHCGGSNDTCAVATSDA
jgi:probable addiction module antidote protein